MKRAFVVILALAALFGAIACNTTACDNNPATSGPRNIPVVASSAPAFKTVMINGHVWAIPSGMDLDKYPILGHKLTQEEQIRYVVHLGRVPENTVLYNEDRKAHAFRIEGFGADSKDLFWLDKDGNAVWKESCGNRVMKPVDLMTCPPSVICAGPHLATGNGKPVGASTTTSKSWTDSLWDFLKFLWPLLLLLLLLLLLTAAALALIDGWRHRTPPVAPTPTPLPLAPPVAPPAPPVVIPPTPPTPPVVPVVPVPTRTVTTTDHYYGPYKEIVVSDRQTDGYHVAGDGNEIGVFKTQGRIKNGYWVMTTTA